MRRVFGIVLVLAAVLAGGAGARARHDDGGGVRWLEGRVAHVSDGDTIVLANGTRIRLLDINTPEISHDGAPAEPGGDAAAVRMRQLVDGKDVRVSVVGKGFDKYGRTLGHVYVGNVWVNGVMVREGFAHVYTFADNDRFGVTLLKLEAAARAEKRGIWALPQWQVFAAATCCDPEMMEHFGLVQGRVLDVAHAGKGTYVNFGPDYRTDFSVWVKDKDMKAFYRRGWANLDCLKGSTVRVHGRMDPVNGVLVHATHPTQIEVLTQGACPLPDLSDQP